MTAEYTEAADHTERKDPERRLRHLVEAFQSQPDNAKVAWITQDQEQRSNSSVELQAEL